MSLLNLILLFLFYKQIKILSMELFKQSLLNIQFFTDPISKNFKLIQDEFKNLNSTITVLKEENIGFKSFISKIQEFIEKSHLKHRLNKQQITNQSVVRVCIQDDSDILRDIQKHQDKINDENISNFLNQFSNSQRRIQMLQTKSQTVTENPLNSCSDQLNGDMLNVPSQQKRKFFSKTPKNQNLLSHIVQNGQLNRQKKTRTPPHGFQQKNGNKNLKKQFDFLNGEINELKQQILQLNSSSNSFKQRMEQIQKENQQFRKCLGLKKKVVLKQKTNTQLSQNQSKSKKIISSAVSKKSISSQMNLENSKRNLEENNQNDQQPIEIPGFRQLYGQVQKIRDYLSGKVRAIDSNFLQINLKIQSIQRDTDILYRTDHSLKQDIQTLQKTCNQTKLNLTQINERSMIGTKSRFRKQNTDENFLTDEKPINQAQQIQQRIVQLLQEMQKLKSQYQDILFGKKDNQNSENQISPQILQKRKKLALKLNGNAVVDQKYKKQLSNCRRDLKKLQQAFDYLMNGVNTGTHQTKTLIIKPNQTKQQWKSLSTKIYKVKQQLQAQVKQLEGKITANNQLAVVLNEFQVGIQQCKIILKKKLDITDFEKTTKRIEGRLNNFIKQTFQKQGYTNQQDALMAKKPWFCLSCDVQLKTFSGKINKNSIDLNNSGQKFVGKKVNPQSHMVRRNQNGRLPSIAI